MNPSIYGSETLDCQQCGQILRELTPAEARKVADSPENFIIYCKSCQKDILK
jgi:hypothetical protein